VVGSECGVGDAWLLGRAGDSGKGDVDGNGFVLGDRCIFRDRCGWDVCGKRRAGDTSHRTRSGARRFVKRLLGSVRHHHAKGTRGGLAHAGRPERPPPLVPVEHFA
jgi:hypothetical protein